MIRKSNNLVKNLFVGFLILVALFTQISYLTTDEGYYTVFLTAAIAAGFYASFGKAILPSIIFSSILGVIVMEMAIHGTSLNDATLYALPVTFINLITPLIFKGSLDLLKVEIPRTISSSIKFVIAILISVIFSAFFPAIEISVVNNSHFLDEYWIYFKPMFVGMMIFTTGIVLSNHYDTYLGEDIFKKGFDIVFVVIFSIFTYLIFSSNIEGFNYSSYGSV